MMNRWKDILDKNILLWVLIMGVGSAILLQGWAYSIRWCMDLVQSVDKAHRDFWEDGDVFYNCIMKNDEGVYLVDGYNRNVLAGPYVNISADFDSSVHIARFESENGLIGFIDRSGWVVIPAIYTSASDFLEGKSTVTDQDGNQYEIDACGRIIS